jgi:hypothetical protein
MKHLVILFLSIFAVSSCVNAQAFKLEKIWETDTIVAVPESVLPDAKSQTLFISLIDGKSSEADGKGGVATMAMNGTNYKADWITGLNAPKGMGRYGNRLYVADLSDLVIIDIAKGKIEKRIPIKGAKALNDVTVTKNGIVYVSEKALGHIYKIENDKYELFLSNIKDVNGLKTNNKELYIIAGDAFMKADAAGKLTPIATITDKSGDAIEFTDNGEFLLSAWKGYLYYVSSTGKVDVLLDSTNEKKNIADIGYDPVKRIVYVPTFNGKTVAAYRLSK